METRHASLTANDYLQLGSQAVANTDFSEAIAFFGKAIELNPSVHEVYFHRANAYFILEQYENAIADFDKTLANEKDNWIAYNARANAHLICNSPATALKDYQQALAIILQDPAQSEKHGVDIMLIYHNAGFASFCLGLVTQSIDYYNQALRNNDTDQDTIFYRSVAYYAQGNQSLSDEGYHRAMQLGYLFKTTSWQIRQVYTYFPEIFYQKIKKSLSIGMRTTIHYLGKCPSYDPKKQIMDCISRYCNIENITEKKQFISELKNKLANISKDPDQIESFIKQLFYILKRENDFPDVRLFKVFLTDEYISDLLKYHLITSNASNPVFIMQPATQLTLTLLTEVSYGTLGDYYAAMTLIQLFQEKHPALTIQWIIRGNIIEIPDELKPNEKTYIFKIDEWSKLPNISILSSVILIFPTFHFLSQSDISYLVSLEKPLLSCLEYSYHDRNKNDHVIDELLTGLDKDEMGIFIRTFPELPLKQITPDQQIYSYLFKEKFLRYGTNKIPISLNQNPENYHQHCLLFFGYANQEINQVVNTEVNLENFIRTCVKLGAQDSRQFVHIVAPITTDTLLAMDIDFSDYQAVGVVTKDEFSINKFYPYSTPKKILIFFNFFRFDNQIFQSLMAASHFFKLCTGDQSFSDVVSCISAVPFYQIMDWKPELANNYYTIAKKALVNAGVNADKSIALEYLKMIYQKTFDLDKIISLLNNKKLLAEFILIHEYIIQYKNLNTTLPNRILNFLNYLEHEKTLLNMPAENNSIEIKKQKRHLDTTEHQEPNNKKMKGTILAFFKPAVETKNSEETCEQKKESDMASQSYVNKFIF